jgi:hypothetical protein
MMMLTVISTTLPLSVAFARQDGPTPTPPIQTEQATPMTGSTVQIISPKDGQALQGSVPIVVDTTTLNFQTVELAFAYADDPTDTWFWIYQGIQPVTGTMLVLWDTSTLTDGDYKLRMQVTFSDGSLQTAIIQDLRVRNYTPVETSTPPPPTPQPTRTPEITPSLFPSGSVQTEAAAVKTAATAPPALTAPGVPIGNPAALDREEILVSAGIGVLVVFCFFLLGLTYRSARTLRHKK